MPIKTPVLSWRNLFFQENKRAVRFWIECAFSRIDVSANQNGFFTNMYILSTNVGWRDHESAEMVFPFVESSVGRPTGFLKNGKLENACSVIGFNSIS